MFSWICRQGHRTGLTVFILRSSIKILMLELVCERSDDHKVLKKRLMHEAMGSRKCECMFKFHGYVNRKIKALMLVILNGVHNHEMAPKLEGKILAGRLKEDD
ncbi:hypothetical protein MTR_6g090600 [Medicago truncatula]|uniref:FAR1 DNA-binding domain protein n=1 Tax=Medicago truncatula TaxID=3880 RepID=G7KI24_MEDTR|nr:hypothetical protein MTR_6g090600 [Medicago truncatula]